MPLVIISVNDDVLVDPPKLARALPAIIAEELDCEDGHLVPADVGAMVRRRDCDDKNLSDISIQVIANDYPARRAKLEGCSDRIGAKLKAAVSIPTGTKCAIWVLLAPGSYTEFQS